MDWIHWVQLESVDGLGLANPRIHGFVTEKPGNPWIGYEGVSQSMNPRIGDVTE